MAQHTKKVYWVPEMYEEATMEREVGDGLSIVNGREGPWVVTKVSRPLEDPWWSGGIPPGRKSAKVHWPGGADGG